jgi:hypothetical protein
VDVAGAARDLTYSTIQRLARVRFSNDGPFEIYVYRRLAGDVAKLTAPSHAGVMTTSYGLAAELNYHRGLAPVVIGEDYRGRESRYWPIPALERRMIVVERVPLSESPWLRSLLPHVCRQFAPGPVLHYRFAGAPARSFYTTYCFGIDPREIAALRTAPPSH